MKNPLFGAAFFAIAWMTTFSSCTDKDEQTAAPLLIEPDLQYPSLVVGSGLDTLPLVSTGTVLESLRDRYAAEWDSRWVCTQKPAGAPDPIIYGETSPSARAVGLRPGKYQFEITYSTQAYTKKKTMEVTVVPDKPAGAIVQLDTLKWNVGQGWLDYEAYASLDNINLVFYRGKQQAPAVEFLDPNSNRWVRASPQTDVQADISTSILRFNAFDQVIFNYRSGRMEISFTSISGNWMDPLGLIAPVRLIY